MGSTNKTANLGLSQYIGTDKPTWLVDYNNDMAVIDEAIGELQNDSGLIDTAIAELQTNVQNLQNEQGDSATEIAEVKSDVQTLSANYETMHHEVVLLDESVKNNQNTVETLEETLSNVKTAVENSNNLTSEALTTVGISDKVDVNYAGSKYLDVVRWGNMVTVNFIQKIVDNESTTYAGFVFLTGMPLPVLAHNYGMVICIENPNIYVGVGVANDGNVYLDTRDKAVGGNIIKGTITYICK